MPTSKSKIFFNNLIFIFFATTLLFPTGIVNKLIFLILMLSVIINLKFYRLKSIAPFIIFYVFLIGFLLSFLNDVDKDLRSQLFLSVLVLFLIYPINKYKINIDFIAKISGLIIAVYTGISFLIIVTFVDSPISSSYFKFFTDVSLGANGLREYIDEGVLSFHIGTVPFVYLSFILYVISFLENKKISSFLAILILLTTIFVSSTRGLIFSCIIAAGYIVFFKSKTVNKIFLLTISVPILLISISYLVNNTNIFSSGESSNSVKIGHIESFFDNINFSNFLFGEGLASYYFSKGRNNLLAQTEITPLDMLRYFGFILAPFLYLIIIFPSKKINSYLGSKSLYVVLFLIYVLNSFSNPIMFNSYGLLIVLWYWHKILDESRVNSETNFQPKNI